MWQVELPAMVDVQVTEQDFPEEFLAKRGLAWGSLFRTSVGRILLNRELPMRLRYYDDVLDKGKVKTLVADCFVNYGPELTAELIDRVTGQTLFLIERVKCTQEDLSIDARSIAQLTLSFVGIKQSDEAGA